MKPIRATVQIRGCVQGVGFRYFTSRVAQQHHLTGWVRNLPDGRVEALFEGRESQVRAVLDLCRQGPGAAAVDDITIEWEAPTGEFTTFEVRR